MSLHPDSSTRGPRWLGIERARTALFPEQPRRLPYDRWINVTFRTAHLVASGLLVGGHAFDITPDRLLPWLILTIATGAGLIGLELYRSCQWIYLGQGILVLVKVLLTILAGLWWQHRVALLTLVIVIGSVGSHMPARYRHYSLVHGRELTFEPIERTGPDRQGANPPEADKM